MGKSSEKRGETGERRCPSIFPAIFLRSLFSAPLHYSLHLSPLSERLEQASTNQTSLGGTKSDYIGNFSELQGFLSL